MMGKLIRTLLVVIVGSILASSAVEAASLKGVTLADTIAVTGQELTLNGIGMRKKLIFNVYVTGLYLPKKTTDAAVAITTNAAKQIVMVFVHSKVAQEKIVAAWNDGFFNNSQEKLSLLQDRINQFNGFFNRDMVKGDRVELTYQPALGTTVTINGTKQGIIPGEDFMQALWSIWLGNNPADARLKEALLG
ncbi:MAG: chalcone isomerase family protein [Deltaproteobacteria bacterium]|nr:chalcone isomerase family protein [Candidatus Anaeroferrophillus wilburensis]MBN2888182.1 chalcone isomerase family protein [Deltaproteobacteria bacterium]